MLLKEKLFLVASSDFVQRKLAFEILKKTIPETLFQSGMVVTIYSDEAELKPLQEDILTFSLAGQKVVIFKNAQDLKEEICDFFADNLEKVCEVAYLIFEFEEEIAILQKQVKSNRFLEALFKNADVSKIKAVLGNEVVFDDLTDALRRNDLNSSIFVLNRLFTSERPEKLGPLLLGMLTARVSYLRDNVKKRKSLQYIFDTDRAIKERSHDTRFALEALITKLLTL